LTVFLPFLLQRRGEISIDIIYTAQITDTMNRTGASINNDVHTAWFGNFVPLLAVYDRVELQWRNDPIYAVGIPFFSNITNFNNVRITTPADFTVIGTGDASVQEMGNRKTTVFTAMQVRDFAFALSNNYKETPYITQTGIHVKTFALSDIDNLLLDYCIALVIDSLDFFSEKIGRYPYRVFNLAETDYMYNLAAYPQIVLVNVDGLLAMEWEAAVLTLLTGVAKQWFYGVVGNDPIREAWLSDGLAYYTAVDFMFRDDEEGLDVFMSELADVDIPKTTIITNTQISSHISIYTSHCEYTAIQQNKAALMFHNLRQIIGHEVYDAFLRIYYNGNYFAVASTERLILAAEEAYGGCLRDFFDYWLR
jgi:hypothetical protein